MIRLLRALRHPENILRYARWLGAKAGPFGGQIAFLVLVDLLGVVIGFASSFVSRNVVDSATAGLPFLPAFSVMILFSAVSIGLGAAVSMARTLIHERFAFGVRLKVFDHILGGDYRGMSRYHSGDLLTRMTSDADTVAGGIISAIPSLFMIFVRLLAAFVMLYGYAPFLALSALILAPAGLALSLLTGEKLKKLAVEVKEQESAYRSFMQEHLANITVVKTFCMEKRSSEHLAGHRGRLLDAVKRRNRVSMLTHLCIRGIFSLGYFISFGYCIFGLASGGLSYGTMTLFLTLFAQIQQPIMGLAQMLPQAIAVVASAGRIMELEAIPAENQQTEAAQAAAVGLRFSHVSFAYDQRPVLQDVSFSVEPGQLVGIMGPSGVGKTTLIRLAMALLKPDAGEALYVCDGREEPVSAASRRLIAYVPQGNSLLSGTIEDNLRWGCPDATEDMLWSALDQAAAGFVRELPEGLHTPLGEKASGLSEGQAQRIAIARALLRRAPVLLLDEATSALDAASEEQVLAALTAPGRAYAPLCLIITHRRSMTPYFDRLLHIGQDGVVSVQGKTER